MATVRKINIDYMYSTNSLYIAHSLYDVNVMNVEMRKLLLHKNYHGEYVVDVNYTPNDNIEHYYTDVKSDNKSNMINIKLKLELTLLSLSSDVIFAKIPIYDNDVENGLFKKIFNAKFDNYTYKVTCIYKIPDLNVFMKKKHINLSAQYIMYTTNTDTISIFAKEGPSTKMYFKLDPAYLSQNVIDRFITTINMVDDKLNKEQLELHLPGLVDQDVDSFMDVYKKVIRSADDLKNIQKGVYTVKVTDLSGLVLYSLSDKVIADKKINLDPKYDLTALVNIYHSLIINAITNTISQF